MLLRTALSAAAVAAAATAPASQAASAAAWPFATAPLAAAPYPAWAHDHFVWLDSDRTNQSSVLAYVAEYEAQNITVGAVDVDSQWATGDNNFIVDTGRFPDFWGFIDAIHAG